MRPSAPSRIRMDFSNEMQMKITWLTWTEKKQLELQLGLSNRNSGFASFPFYVFESVSVTSRIRYARAVDILNAIDNRRSRIQASARTLAPALSSRLIVLKLNCVRTRYNSEETLGGSEERKGRTTPSHGGGSARYLRFPPLEMQISSSSPAQQSRHCSSLSFRARWTCVRSDVSLERSLPRSQPQARARTATTRTHSRARIAKAFVNICCFHLSAVKVTCQHAQCICVIRWARKFTTKENQNMISCRWLISRKECTNSPLAGQVTKDRTRIFDADRLALGAFVNTLCDIDSAHSRDLSVDTCCRVSCKQHHFLKIRSVNSGISHLIKFIVGKGENGSRIRH